MPAANKTVIKPDPALLEKDLTGKIVIITGANSGCGLETARQLSSQKATVILACRNKERGETAAMDVMGHYMNLDLADLDSVRSFVKEFKSKYQRLDILVNNGAIMACPLWRTKQNFEMQIGTNHFGHFLLTSLLKDYLEKSAPSRVICVSSVAAAQMANGFNPAPGNIDFDDLNWETRKYDPAIAYQQSKLCNYFHAQEIAKRYKGVTATSVHPGWVQSPLMQHMAPGCAGMMIRFIFRECTGDIIQPKEGAYTHLHCCLADNIENGAYYSQYGIYEDEASKAGGWPMKFPNPNDKPETAKRLWEVSEKLVGL